MRSDYKVRRNITCGIMSYEFFDVSNFELVCQQQELNTHPGRLRWNLQITHFERNIILQTSVILFHVNLPGCMTNRYQPLQSDLDRFPKSEVTSAPKRSLVTLVGPFFPRSHWFSTWGFQPSKKIGNFTISVGG